MRRRVFVPFTPQTHFPQGIQGCSGRRSHPAQVFSSQQRPRCASPPFLRRRPAIGQRPPAQRYVRRCLVRARRAGWMDWRGLGGWRRRRWSLQVFPPLVYGADRWIHAASCLVPLYSSQGSTSFASAHTLNPSLSPFLFPLLLPLLL